MYNTKIRSFTHLIAWREGGSLTELQNQLLVSRDLGYINNATFKNIAEQTVVISKLTNGLIKSSREFNT